MKSNPTDSKQAQHKQWMLLAILIASVVAIGFVLAIVMKNKHQQITTMEDEKPNFSSALANVEDGPIILEQAQQRALQAEEKAQLLEDKISQLTLNQENTDRLLQAKLDALEKTLNLKTMASNQQFANDPLANTSHVSNYRSRQVSIRQDKLQLATMTDTTESELPDKTPENYVPTGTFAKAIMLGGADASAAVNAQGNPAPMLFRIVNNGTLPNKAHSHLKDCFVTAAVVGDISSERGLIRLENLSCTKRNQESIDINVEGTIFGPEGKNGIRGIPVWRENALLQRAFTAGALSGLSEGLAMSYTTNSVSPLGNTQSVGNNKILQYGMSQGLGKAMDRLAQYNIERAEQYHPVIQLSAGVEVDVVFLKGFYLNKPAAKHLLNPLTTRAAPPTALINTMRDSPFSATQLQNLNSLNQPPAAISKN